MQTATTELNSALQRLGEIVYSQSDGPVDDGSAPGGDTPMPNDASEDSVDDDGTVEGEFREV